MNSLSDTWRCKNIKDLETVFESVISSFDKWPLCDTLEEYNEDFESFAQRFEDKENPGEYVISTKNAAIWLNGLIDKKIEDSVNKLEQEGYLDVTFDENGEKLYSINEEGKKKVDKIYRSIKNKKKDV